MISVPFIACRNQSTPIKLRVRICTLHMSFILHDSEFLRPLRLEPLFRRVVSTLACPPTVNCCILVDLYLRLLLRPRFRRRFTIRVKTAINAVLTFGTNVYSATAIKFIVKLEFQCLPLHCTVYNLDDGLKR